ncbi:MAG TPA: phospholipase D-like domain-containing protein [Vicinamibacteria bacterium]|nr:phospholipase D-like domain-containing protein [Vicinamibacteria bacterium]
MSATAPVHARRRSASDTGTAEAARALAAVRLIADQAFSRAAGAPLVPGNAVRILKDGAENYPAWLSAMAAAREHVHFECYILHDDDVGHRFAEALIAAAGRGVRVRVVYDWLGALGKTRRRFWRHLRDHGVEVRMFNPPRFDHPMGWLARNHRKSLVVDGTIAFVTGLCVGKAWEGWPERGLPGWRDTGVEVRGPAVADVGRAFAEAWAACGEPLPEGERGRAAPPPEGEVGLRVVATTSGTAGLYRLDPLVAALARSTLWLTDAYYAGTPAYVQALRAAARDGVDVRLLVPGRGSDIAIVQTISRAGYRPLLDAGVRVFEWNGPMLHAKTAVADARWSRVGSTNLNPASWMGNWELDVVVEDEPFGHAMEAMYADDLTNATEIVLERRRRVRPAGEARIPRRRGGGGGASRAAAGALRFGNALGTAMSARHITGMAERRLMAQGGSILVLLAAVAFFWPPALAWPLGALVLWLGISLLLRAARLRPAGEGGAADGPVPKA